MGPLSKDVKESHAADSNILCQGFLIFLVLTKFVREMRLGVLVAVDFMIMVSLYLLVIAFPETRKHCLKGPLIIFSFFSNSSIILFTIEIFL